MPGHAHRAVSLTGMRHKYTTRAIVLARVPSGEATALVTLLTEDLGLMRVRAQSLRKPGAKLAPALVTFAESNLMLVRGKEGWRLTGAVLEENWARRLTDPDARRSAARVSGLLLRLVAGEAHDLALFHTLRSFFDTLTTLSAEDREAAEIIAVLQILAELGLDDGELPEGAVAFAPEALSAVRARRTQYIARINHDITASGL